MSVSCPEYWTMHCDIRMNCRDVRNQNRRDGRLNGPQNLPKLRCCCYCSRC